MQQWKFPSSSGPGEYTTTLTEDGLLSCDCRGFLIKKKDKPRYCTHTDKIVKKLGLNIVQRGDYQFAVDAGTVQMDLIPQVDHGDRYHTAKERGYFNPMLAIAPEKGKTVDDYDADDYVMELKYDGERKIVSGHKGEVYTWNRPRAGEGEVGKEEPLPPQIHQAFVELAKVVDFTVDGEMYLPGAGTQSTDVNRIENRPKLLFAAFDILRLQEQTCLDLRYSERRPILEALIKSLEFPGEPTVVLSQQWEPSQQAVQDIWDNGGEGVILKLKTSVYRPGYRSKDWTKVKVLMHKAMVITGYKKGKNGPYSSVCLGHADGSKTDVKTKDNEWLRKIEANPDYYIGKTLMIEYRGRSTNGGYRHPMWQYLEEEVS